MDRRADRMPSPAPHRLHLTKESIMTYDNTNKGVLFSQRDNKTKDDDRDYSGSINIEGTEYWLSGWVKTSKKGNKFLSLAVKPKEEKTSASGGSIKRDMDDEIPFAPEWR
jgi:hypothetical protein